MTRNHQEAEEAEEAGEEYEYEYEFQYKGSRFAETLLVGDAEDAWERLSPDPHKVLDYSNFAAAMAALLRRWSPWKTQVRKGKLVRECASTQASG